MFVLILFNEHAKNFPHGGKTMAFALADVIDQAILQLHQLTIFTVVMRHEQRRFNVRPDRGCFFNLSCGHNYFIFHWPMSYSG